MNRRVRVSIVITVAAIGTAAAGRELGFKYRIDQAQSLFDRGEPAAAERAFDQALRIKPESIRALVGRAEAREQSGDAGATLAQLREAVAQHPGEGRLYLEMARALGREGARLQADRQRQLYDEAVRAYEAAVALRPQDAAMLNDVGLGLRSIGRVDLAIDAFQKAAALAPAWGGPDVNLADTYRDAARYEDAIRVFQRLETRTVEIPAYRIQNALAQVYLDFGKPSQAEEILGRVVGLNPQYSPVRVTLALALVDQRRYSEATRELEEAIRIDPQADTLFFMCQLYALQKRAHDVVRCLGRAVPAGTSRETIRKDVLFRFVHDNAEYQRLVGATQAP